MKRKFSPIVLMMAVASTCSAQSLYYKGSEAQDSVPLTFTVGAQMTFDDNVAPGELTENSSLGFNPYVGATFVTITPQTTWNVYVRLGLVYLFDAPPEIDDVTSQSRAGINFTHRFSERLRFTSENFLSYELEPDFANGIGASRRLGAFFAWSTNNSIGYRWTERFGNYLGMSVNGVNYDAPDNDRLTWELYNQFRYQLGPQTVLTGDYRYSETAGDGRAEDSTNQFLLVGVEQRFSPTMVGVARLGAQLRDVEGGDSISSPYAELALNSSVNKAFSLKAFTRYGIESGDTVREFNGNFIDFNERQTLRVGVSGDYVISPTLSLFTGVDYIPTTFASGRNASNSLPIVGELNEDLFNGYIGVSMKINEMLTASLSYNYTDSSSDFANQTFERNRISIGVSAQF
jgi:hypothetical protein